MQDLSFQLGIEAGPLQWKHGILTTGPPGKSLHGVFDSYVLFPKTTMYFKAGTEGLQLTLKDI